MWDDKQIDAAIDETGRQMTAGEPGADFRARVMARIDARPRSIAMWRPALAGLTVVALIIIAVVVSRDRQRPASRVASAPASIVRLPESDATSTVRLKPDVAYEAKPEPPLVRLPPSPLGGFGGPRKPDATYERDTESLELPSIDLDSIAVAALAATDPIAIEPLPPAPSIAVTPLGVENEGDRR